MIEPRLSKPSALRSWLSHTDSCWAFGPYVKTQANGRTLTWPLRNYWNGIPPAHLATDPALA
jgi:hypothetical protein